MSDTEAFALWLSALIAQAAKEVGLNPTVEGVAFLGRLLDLGGLPKITPPASASDA